MFQHIILLLMIILNTYNNPLLQVFLCDNNHITQLNLRNNAQLLHLTCNGNQISSLDVGGLDRLTTLECCDNSMTSLNIRYCSSLKSLKCWGNLFDTIDVTGCDALENIERDDWGVQIITPNVPEFSSQDTFYYGFCALAPLATETNEGWVVATPEYDFTPNNVNTLIATYGANPVIEWSWEYLGGLHVNVLLSQGEDPYTCHVVIPTLPSEAGNADFNLICNWNGYKGRIPVRIVYSNIPANVPSDLTIPSEIMLHVGETKSYVVNFPDGQYDITSYYSWIDANWEYVSARTLDEDFHVSLTGNKVGTIQTTAIVGCGAGLSFKKKITVKVVN